MGGGDWGKMDRTPIRTVSGRPRAPRRLHLLPPPPPVLVLRGLGPPFAGPQQLKGLAVRVDELLLDCFLHFFYDD